MEMTGPQDQFNPFGPNWNDFRKHFDPSQKGIPNQDSSWIEDYVKGVLSQVLPDDTIQNHSIPIRLRPDVIDTHHYIIVRAKIPEHANTRNMKVFFNTGQVRLSGLTEKEEVVSLPSPGRYNGSKAIFKDDILEIRIPKELNEPDREITIQFL